MWGDGRLALCGRGSQRVWGSDGTQPKEEERGEAVGEAEGVFTPLVCVECLTPGSPVCTAGFDLFLTTQPLEASGTEAEERARLVHTGTPIEA